MNQLNIWNCLLLLLTTNLAHAQIRGTVTDTSGEPLPFATVYVQGTTQGTTTNVNGVYTLELDKGAYRLVFQYIGYRQKIEAIQVGGKPLTVNVALEEETIELPSIEIRANAEDPAYPIIRKAIAKREYYRDQVKAYACDVYIKGNVKILDAPEKILGQDVGDMEGSLDTNRQGIVYLSESVSKLYFQAPNRKKEVMVSSKVSGNDNGFSFNSAQDMDMDMYRNFSEFGRNVISPIADGAMGYYRYRLEGVMLDEEGRLINKIAVLPKREEDPAYRGYIYIVDKLWNIQSADLFLTGKAVQQPFFDTFYIRQTHVPVAEPDVWRLFSQTFSLEGGVFGFKFGGSFTGIYSNYDLQPNLPDGFFGNEIMKVEEGANEKDTAYWNAVRPVPLTVEEETDYVRKDSIQEVRSSKPFLDSLDRKNNQFKFNNLFFGYTWNNSWKRRSWSIESPFKTIQLNAVQGFNVYAGLTYRNYFDEQRNRWLETKGQVSYGFSEKIVRASGEATFNFNRRDFSRLMVSGGRDLAQFSEANPIPVVLNSFYVQFFHRNYIKLYDKTFVKGDFYREIVNGVLVRTTLEWAKRSPVENNSDFSFFYRDSRTYEPNIPQNDFIPEGGLAENQAIIAGVSVRLRIRQKYMNYPDRKYIMGSRFPTIWLHYKKGIALNAKGGDSFRSDVNFDRLSAVMYKEGIALGLGGEFSFRIEAGKFLNDKQLYFQDFKHFNGNQTNIGNPDIYLNGFKLLPYYQFSSRDAWFQANVEHHFKGFITDKIPGLKKLGWGLVAGGGFIYTNENRDYSEVSLGLDNIGFGVVRLFRFDVAAAFKNGKYDGLGWLLGLRFPTGEISI
jgi:hypothetical protein